MRAVLQRVIEAAVSIGGAAKGAIQNGLVVLLAVEEADTADRDGLRVNRRAAP